MKLKVNTPTDNLRSFTTSMYLFILMESLRSHYLQQSLFVVIGQGRFQNKRHTVQNNSKFRKSNSKFFKLYASNRYFIQVPGENIRIDYSNSFNEIENIVIHKQPERNNKEFFNTCNLSMELFLQIIKVNNIFTAMKIAHTN